MDQNKLIIEDREIDLRNIFKLFKRNKNIIFSFSGLGVILSFFTPIFVPKLWMGEFQIVLQNDQEKIEILSRNFKGLTSGIDLVKNNLETQVEILTSPSVLINIFNFVKEEKKKEDISYESMSFRDWKKNLKVELKANTSVMNLSYKDTDKNLIIPVLNKISQKYVSFNTENKSKEIEELLDFYNNQIDLFKLRSVSSFQEAQQFGIENDLFLNIAQGVDTYFTTESERVKQTNYLRTLKQKLKKIELLNEDSEKLVFLARDSLNNLNQINPLILERMQNLDNQFEKLKSVYLDSDILIKQSVQERKDLKRKIKIDLIELFNSEILLTQANIKALERPKNILIKFSELSNQAKRDMKTLQLLEDESRSLSLELYKKDYPWKLITNPTLLPSHLSPRLREYVLRGLIVGFLIGLVLTVYKDKKEDVFYDEEELENIFNIPILEILNKKDKLDIKKKIKFITSIDKVASLKEVGFIFEGQIQDNVVDLIKDGFKNYMNLDNVIFSSDLLETAKHQSQIIIIELEVTKRKKLLKLIKKIISNKFSIVGILVLK